MKAIAYVLAIIGSYTATSSFAGEEQAALASLPLKIFVITEPLAKGPPGSSRIYEVTRNGKNLTVIFTSEANADAFSQALPDGKVHNRSITPVPKSFIRDAQRQGTLFLLDPSNIADGGSRISVEVEIENPELKAICDEDQADRRPASGKQIDWSVVGPRDAKRLARVKELYREEKLSTGSDYFHAALVLQHGSVPEDYLLAHEFAIVAVKNGYQGGASLAAASEDRFLQSIGRKQRFGTQLSDPIVVDGDVSDRLRDELSVPPLKVEEEKAKTLH